MKKSQMFKFTKSDPRQFGKVIDGVGWVGTGEFIAQSYLVDGLEPEMTKALISGKEFIRNGGSGIVHTDRKVPDLSGVLNEKECPEQYTLVRLMAEEFMCFLKDDQGGGVLVDKKLAAPIIARAFTRLQKSQLGGIKCYKGDEMIALVCPVVLKKMKGFSPADTAAFWTAVGGIDNVLAK